MLTCVLSSKGLENLINLRELDLSNNDIEKIDGLSTLKRLRSLNLSFNKITKIEGLSGLKSLEILNLSNNLIESISPILLQNTTITELYLTNNNISKKDDILSLITLQKLYTLDLSNNPIAEIYDYQAFVLEQLPQLQYLDSKYIDRNGRRRHVSQEPRINTANMVYDSTGFDFRSPDNNRADDFRNSYERRLQSTQSKLKQISLLNNQVQLMSTDRKENPQSKFMNHTHSGVKQLNFIDRGDFAFENEKRKSLGVISEIPKKGLGQQKMKNLIDGSITERGRPLQDISENTLYNYSETIFDQKSKTSPLMAQRGRNHRYSDKEDTQEMLFTQFTQFTNSNMETNNNPMGASQLNISSIDNVTPIYHDANENNSLIFPKEVKLVLIYNPNRRKILSLKLRN